MKIIIKYLLSRFETVSFDIFDTLIVRNVQDPRDIFRNINKSEDNKFVKYRIEAEKKAREKKESKEVTLNEIYNEMLKFYNKSEVENFESIEKKEELNSVCPRKKIVDIYNECLASGKKVYLISDMYLPRELIEKMLQKCKIKNYEKLYISNEFGKTKKTGELFQLFVESEKITTKTHLHIGDSIRADFYGAKKAKLKTFFIYRRHFFKRAINTIIGRYV